MFLFSFLKKEKNQKQNLNPKKNEFRVAYFPHKGMFSQGKIKDQFYLKNKASKFYKRNIAHIEWYNSDLTNQSNEYYVKNNIPFFLGFFFL